MLATPAPAGAHPLDNFTINTALAVTVTASGIEAQLVVDMAEIPALQTTQRLDADDDGTSSVAERSAYRTTTCHRWPNRSRSRSTMPPRAFGRRSPA